MLQSTPHPSEKAVGQSSWRESNPSSLSGLLGDGGRTQALASPMTTTTAAALERLNAGLHERARKPPSEGSSSSHWPIPMRRVSALPAVALAFESLPRWRSRNPSPGPARSAGPRP